MEIFSVLVTGANRGIGLEFTRQLLQSENPPKFLFATYRNPDGIQELEKLRDSAPVETTVKLIRMDVRDTNQIEAMKKFIEDQVGENGLTLLINNAGVAQAQTFPNITVENFNFHFGINTVGPLMIAQALYPLLKKAALKQNTSGMSFSKAGILNLTSLVGSISNTGVQFTQDLEVPGYKMSKAALNMGMRVLAAKSKVDKILVIVMCPGWVRTDMGTAHGEIEPNESIAAMLDTISKLNEEHQGMYLNRFGITIPW